MSSTEVDERIAELVSHKLDLANLDTLVAEQGTWIVEPVIPTSRRVHIHSVAGVGKSLLCLE